MKKILSTILVLTIFLSLCSFNVFADTTASADTYAVVKSASKDTDGMWFNVNAGGKSCGIESLGNQQYAEDGTLNYQIFLNDATDDYFGKVMQFDVRGTTSNVLSYRFPLNMKTGYQFGTETLTNLTDKFFYVSYYMKSVPGENDVKKDPYLKTDGGIRNESKTDCVTQFTGIGETSYTYNENWQKFQGTHLATAETFGARDLTNQYSTFSGAPFLRFTFKSSLENYSVQVADFNVVMFDSEESYNNVKDVSTLKSLSFDGEALDVSETEFSFEPENVTSVSQLTDMISYTPYVDCNRVDVSMPEYLPGDIVITSYALSADVTNSSETKKTVYKIHIGAETSNVKLNANFYSKKADVSADIIENENAYIYVAFYNENGKVIEVNRYESKSTGTPRTFTEELDVPDGTVKAKAFLWNAQHQPLTGSAIQTKKIIKSEFVTNGGFEDGTRDGWTSTTVKNVVENEGYNSDYSLKIVSGNASQDITADVANAGQGFYYLTARAKGVTDTDVNARIFIRYRLEGDTEDRNSSIRTLKINNQWTQLNEVIEISDYIQNDDGSETLDTNSQKAVTKAEICIASYKNDTAYPILFDDVSMSKISELDGTVINKINKPSVFVISDSLGQDYEVSRYPRQGWGYTLRDYIDQDNVNYFNIAVSGWSTRTFMEGVLGTSSFTRPVWHRYKTAIKDGDYVIISLGHNELSGTKATTVEEYKAFLKTMVDDTRNAGGKVIFISNVPNANPVINNSYKNSVYTRYQEVFVPFAAELGVPCINMNLAMTEMENELLKDEAYKATYQNGRSEHQRGIYLFNLKDNGFMSDDSGFDYSAASNPDPTTGAYFDPTHIQFRGAQYVADFLKNQFVTKGLGIKDYLEVKETELISNGGFEVGLYDWTVPETRTFTFEVPEGTPQRFGNNFGNLTTTGTISQDITTALKTYGGKVYTLSADVSADVSVVVIVNGKTVATPTLSQASKTAQIDLSSVSDITNATIEFSTDAECTYDNISMK